VGINSAIFSQSGGSVGIGFAIPINLAKELLPQLRQGLVKHAYIGVLSQDITPDLQHLLDLQTDTGALVSDVDPQGPAAKAGIQRGDVILSFDGKPIKNSRTLPLIVAFTEIGKKAEVQVMRRNKTIRLQILLAEMVEAEQTAESQSTDVMLGMALQTLTPIIAQKYGLNRTEGILILNVQEGSPAAEAGFQQGDVIIEINRQAVEGMDALTAIASQLPVDAKLLFLVDRGGYTVYVPLGLS
jgi:serine protease Do